MTQQRPVQLLAVCKLCARTCPTTIKKAGRPLGVSTTSSSLTAS
ncbi:hypothetical protein LEMLEM_LOCUS14667 [Lemmus lemmus]